jgi:hypothetical protein
MLGMFESATWPLRKLVWWIEEKLLWPIADAFRSWTGRSFAHTRVEAIPDVAVDQGPDLGVPKEKRPLMPRTRARIRARVGRPGRDLLVVLGTVGAAAAVGIGIASLAGGSGVKPGASTRVGVAGPGIPAPPPISAATRTPAGPAELQGAAPSFKPSSAQGTSTSQSQASPTQGTNSAPSSIPPAVGGDMSALHAARDFAGAFVLYEVGKSSPKVKQTFARTATPALAKALRDRPPRLPSSVKVPTAKVENVVLRVGSKKGNQVDASVSLIRLGALSELRLTLIRHRGNWLVSEVRG